MIWFYCLMITLGSSEQGAAEATDWMRPSAWTGNFWGPAATRARATGQLPPLPTNAAMTRWRSWGRDVLREGDIVFRLGDARALRGTFPLSRFIAKATGSPFSHTGIVAVEDGSPVVYDCSSAGVQRQPFEVWMLDCIGAFGIKRLKPEHRHRIPGVIGYCRSKFEQQVPFDFGFRPDDAAFYCVELTEKAFRSQGLALSQPVRIGDWEHLDRYPLTALATPYVTRLMLRDPITLEQPVYLPGDERQGVWASSLLETVVGPGPEREREAAPSRDGRLSLRGDLELAVFAAGELRRPLANPQVSDDIRMRRWVSGDARRPETLQIAIDEPLLRRVR
jgi:Permuted papain-like amidase enzyme, YaeF/YiiX, C92 family